MAADAPSPPPDSLLVRHPRAGLALAVAVGVAAMLWLRQGPPPATRVELTPVIESLLGDPGSPSLGLATAPVTIVVFTDYQCAVCKATDPALARLLAADPSVRVIFKDWPIFGEGSKAAARTALAANRQGRYLAVHQALMAAHGPLDAERARGIALATGLDARRLATDELQIAPALDAQLRRHALQALSLGLRGTPGYLVGPYLVKGGLDDRRLAALVRRARRTGPPQAAP